MNSVYHVAFMEPRMLDLVLDGSKTWEFRISSFYISWMQVCVGHRILFKRSGGAIEAMADVAEVVGNLNDLPHAEIVPLIERMASFEAERVYLRSKPIVRYGVAIRLANVRRISFPDALTPKGVRAGWAGFVDVGEWTP